MNRFPRILPGPALPACVALLAALLVPDARAAEPRAAGADARIGFAESRSGFRIERGESGVRPRGGAPASLLAGDGVRAGDDHVRVQLLDGSSVLLQKDAAASFLDPLTLGLSEGEVVVSLVGSSRLEVVADGLFVEPVGAQRTEGDAPVAEDIAREAKETRLAAVSRPEPDRVMVAGFDRPFAVRTGPDRKGLAVIGAKDRVTFVRKDGEWLVAQDDGQTPAAETPAEAAPEVAEKYGDPADDEFVTKRRRRAGGGGYGGGAVIAPGGSFVLSPLGVFTVVGTGVTTVVTATPEDKQPETSPTNP